MRSRRGKAKLIDQWGKGNGDVIRVELSKYKGHDMIAARTWTPRADGDDWPLNNGLSLTVEHLPKLARAIKKALKQARKDGLV
jgi:Transcriptional Coactivator p15 (PC4)